MRKPAPPTELDIQVGKMIRAMRWSKGLSMAALADLAETSENQIHRMESANGSSTLRSLDKVTRALGYKLSVEFFQAGDETGD